MVRPAMSLRSVSWDESVIDPGVLFFNMAARSQMVRYRMSLDMLCLAQEQTNYKVCAASAHGITTNMEQRLPWITRSSDLSLRNRAIELFEEENGLSLPSAAVIINDTHRVTNKFSINIYRVYRSYQKKHCKERR